MLRNFQNILVISPHTDDGEIGAGGLIDKAIRSGCLVDYLAFSAAEDSVPEGFDRNCLRREVISATSKLGILPANVEVLNYQVRNFAAVRQNILDDLIRIRNRKKYDLVLVPARSDIHQDHATITNEAIRAFKSTSILGYELIWNQLNSSSACFILLDEENLQAKIDALHEYESQIGRAYTSAAFIRSWAITRGVQAGSDFAEKFDVIRLYG